MDANIVEVYYLADEFSWIFDPVMQTPPQKRQRQTKPEAQIHPIGQ
jgi:hypothetical protein